MTDRGAKTYHSMANETPMADTTHENVTRERVHRTDIDIHE